MNTKKIRSGSRTTFFSPPQFSASLLAQKAFHCPLAQGSCGQPHICILLPALVLGRSELAFQQLRTGFSVLIEAQAIFQISPTAINHLGTGFDTQLLVRAWNLVLHYLDIARREPLPLATYFDGLFAMQNSVVQNSL